MSESELSLYARTKPNYRKHYVPLESDPEIFSELIQNLGVRGYEFQDVYSLDDPDLLSFIPRPVYALILVFPEGQMDQTNLKETEKTRKVYEGKGEGEPTIWYAQTIQNACGLYAVLHAVSNGIDRTKIGKSRTILTGGSLISNHHVGKKLPRFRGGQGLGTTRNSRGDSSPQATLRSQATTSRPQKTTIGK